MKESLIMIQIFSTDGLKMISNDVFDIDDFIMKQLEISYHQECKAGCFSGTLEDYMNEYYRRENDE